MKSLIVVLAVCLSLVAGCQYDDPLVVENTLPIDPAVLGVWEPIVEVGKKADEDERMVIMKLSDTEYVVNYPSSEGLCYRAYPIKVGNVSCIQLEVLRAEDGPLGKHDQLFQVVSYELTKDRLEIKTLNSERVDASLEGMEALKEAFLEHQDEEDLFDSPGIFQRVKG